MQTKNVLVVDGDPESIKEVCTILENEGCSYDVVKETKEVDSRIRSGNYLVIICDHRMQEIHLDTILKYWASRDPRLAFIVLANDHEKAIKELSSFPNVVALIQKPVQNGNLSKPVRDVFEQYR